MWGRFGGMEHWKEFVGCKSHCIRMTKLHNYPFRGQSKHRWKSTTENLNEPLMKSVITECYLQLRLSLLLLLRLKYFLSIIRTSSCSLRIANSFWIASVTAVLLTFHLCCGGRHTCMLAHRCQALSNHFVRRLFDLGFFTDPKAGFG